MPAGEYVLSGCPSGGSGSSYWIRLAETGDGGFYADDTGNGKAFTLSADTEIVCSATIRNGVSAPSAAWKPMIRLASDTDATFEPYSNICPIEGYTGVEVERTEINIWDGETALGYWRDTDGMFVPTSSWLASKHFIPCEPSTEYFCFANTSISGSFGIICMYDKHRNYLGFINTPQAKNKVFTTFADAYFMTFYASALYSSSDISINYPATETGYHESKVQRTPVNISINQWDEEWEVGNINDATGEKESGTATYRSKNYIPVKPSTTYFFCGSSPVRYIWAYAYDKDKNFIQRIVRPDNNDIRNTMQTTPDNCYYVLFKASNSGSPATEYITGLSINYPATFTDYYPYTGNGVAYSGTIDLNTGKMVLDSQFYQYDGTENWQLVSNNQYYALNNYQPFAKDTVDGKCSHFRYGSVNSTYPTLLAGINASSGRYVLGGKAIMDATLGISDVTGWKSWIASQYAVGTPLQIWYRLKEPITIQLTPQQLQMLKGLNYVWTDADAIELDYYVDKDKKLAVVGNAEQLLSKEMVNDQEPYLFRASGGNGADREYDTLVGGTICWNQMFKNGNFQSDYAYWQLTGGSGTVANNTLTVTVTSAGNANRIEQRNLVGLANHVYMVLAEINPSKQTKVSIEVDSGNPFTGYIQIDPGVNFFSPILKTNTDFTIVRFYFNRQTFLVNDDTVAFKRLQLFDLTAMFGSTIADYIYNLEQATAGSGIAWLKKYGFFTKPYYAYNAGELMSVKATRHKMVGFNQWDEEWEVGAYNATTGEPTVSSQIRSKSNDPIKVKAGESYCFTNLSARISQIYWYDANDNFIDKTSNTSQSVFVATVPTGATYMRFQCPTAYGTTYKYDVCINISKTTGSPKNGDYVPYTTYEYPLDPKLTLQGIYKLNGDKLYCDGDKYYPDKGVERRVRLVDLGSLTWTYQSANTIFIAGGLPSIPKINGNTEPPDIWTTTDYVPIRPNGYNATVDKSISLGNSTSAAQVWIRDTSYTDVATFKSAMSGKYLVYYESTPYFEQADPFEPLQVLDPYGTEEYVDDREVPIPVGHDTNYPANLRAEVERMMKQIPVAPANNGTYVLKVIVSGGVPSYEWVVE